MEKNIMDDLKSYEDQLERIKRWKVEIDKELYNYKNESYSKNIYFLFDMVYAFFIFCHHMSDYLINDNSLSIEKTVVREYIKNNECLRVCADICNGVKHLEFDRPTKTKGGHVWVNLNITINGRTGEKMFFIDFESETVKQDFSKLSTECIQKWEEFIKKEIK